MLKKYDKAIATIFAQLSMPTCLWKEVYHYHTCDDKKGTQYKR